MTTYEVLENLGYANGWEFKGGTPQIVKDCREMDHELRGRNIGNCLNEYSCDICGYTYKVDSSG